MTVDFKFKRAPGYNVAAIQYVGSYGEQHLRKEFRSLVAWAKRHGIRSGKWIFRELDGPYSRRPDNRRRWEADLEIKGPRKARDGFASRGFGRRRWRASPSTRTRCPRDSCT